MLARRLEPELMDTPEEAREYDAMDHSAVNRLFVSDFLTFRSDSPGRILDVGTGSAQIPIELCHQATAESIVGLDAAGEMLKVARENVSRAGLDARIQLVEGNANHLPFPSAHFEAVMSNSIIHHIPDPYDCFSEMARVCKHGGHIFVRDLLRPNDEPTLNRLVETYAAGANEHQRKLFHDSLWAALTLAEVQTLVAQLGFSTATVAQTSDRHWTWSAVTS